jgi:hypothetical protein
MSATTPQMAFAQPSKFGGNNAEPSCLISSVLTSHPQQLPNTFASAIQGQRAGYLQLQLTILKENKRKLDDATQDETKKRQC